MKFSIEISGSHTEGPEASVRFEKLTLNYVDSLRSAGFLVDSVSASADTDGKPSEILRKKGENTSITTDPDPASWQAAVMSIAAREPAKAEASTVATLNADAVSKAAERDMDAKVASTKAGDTKFTDASETAPTSGTTSTDDGVDETAPDEELKKHDDPSLALDPVSTSPAEIKKALTENLYTVDELEAAIKDEQAGKNRASVVSALEAARDARQKANEAVPA